MKKMIAFFFSISMVSMMACHHDKKPTPVHQEKIFSVTQQDYNEQLYFTGVLTPLDIHTVNAAADGTIEKQLFHYGDPVKKDQCLFEIQSSSLEKDFHASLVDYLKARHEYGERQRQFVGSKKLWELQFIAANEFYADRNALEEAHTNLVQSQYKLQQLLHMLGNSMDFKTIQLKTPAEIDHMLAQQTDKLSIFSPKSGVALAPNKQLGNSEAADPPKPGSTVKAGQPLVNIGDMSGLRIFLKVNEINVNQLKVGQAVTVTGAAFPGITLCGTVTAISAQADSDANPLPSFPITVTIPTLTPEQQHVIHVGMSAKVAITLAHPKEILIPLTAVTHLQNKEWVQRIDPKTGRSESIPVITGKTTATQVAVKQGLKPGDRIVYTD